MFLFKDSKTKKIINKRFYSFATKYCHKSKPDSYPIYDSNVDYILRKYRKENREHFKFSNADLKDYKEFKKIINDFRDYYKLDSLNYRRLDHFLWLYGKDEKNKQMKKKS